MEIIKQFVDCCNNRNHENAFAMLTEDCKNEFENNIQNFKNDFYNKVFSSQRTYKLELMFKKNNMYKFKMNI